MRTKEDAVDKQFWNCLCGQNVLEYHLGKLLN
jgi:hypothetical protein